LIATATPIVSAVAYNARGLSRATCEVQTRRILGALAPEVGGLVAKQRRVSHPSLAA